MSRPARLTSAAATVLLVGIVIGENRAVRLAALLTLAGLAGLALGWLLTHSVFPAVLYLLQRWPWPPGR